MTPAGGEGATTNQGERGNPEGCLPPPCIPEAPAAPCGRGGAAPGPARPGGGRWAVGGSRGLAINRRPLPPASVLPLDGGERSGAPGGGSPGGGCCRSSGSIPSREGRGGCGARPEAASPPRWSEAHPEERGGEGGGLRCPARPPRHRLCVLRPAAVMRAAGRRGVRSSR